MLMILINIIELKHLICNIIIYDLWIGTQSVKGTMNTATSPMRPVMNINNISTE